MNRNQEVLNMKNEKGLKKKKISKRRETKKVVFCLEISSGSQCRQNTKEKMVFSLN